MRNPRIEIGRWILAPVLAIAAAANAGAALSVYLDPVELAERAPLIVRGVVVEAASGLDPETGRMATYATLDVTDVLRGPESLSRVVVREPGGRFGDWVHEVDAVPVYVPGEEVIAFLEASSDGALRTAGMFFGKYAVVPAGDGAGTDSVRDLGGRGLIVGRPTEETERVSTDDLVRTVVSTPPRSLAGNAPGAGGVPGPAWRAVPPETDRLLWDDIRAVGSGGVAAAASGSVGSSRFARADGTAGIRENFVLLSSTNPARWYETDSGTTLRIDVDPARDPLGSPQAAVDTIADAMAAWTAVPESRLSLTIGDSTLDYTAAFASSPAKAYPSVNVVLFGDPYDDISDPSGCSGTLAIGGYWRSGATASPINGVTYHRALRAYVIFNDGFECFLGNPANLAEVATHELGHAIGLGHSAVPDAVMRSYAYGGGRGARLGDDDRDAAHCVYPHGLGLTDPAGGETLTAGSVHLVRWNPTDEAGPDVGEVDLEVSDDGGATWSPVVKGTPNDGSHAWTVPGTAGDRYRFRVRRPNRVAPTPAPWPEACSASASSADFSVVAAPPVAGVVPDGASGAPLLVARDPSGGLRLTWDPSCSSGASDYAVYRGTLDALRAGTPDLVATSCGTGSATQAVVDLPGGDAYFLVAPLAGGSEGGLGTDSSGLERPAASAACAPRETASTCDGPG